MPDEFTVETGERVHDVETVVRGTVGAGSR
jgi:hypothetical protein